MYIYVYIMYIYIYMYIYVYISARPHGSAAARQPGSQAARQPGSRVAGQPAELGCLCRNSNSTRLQPTGCNPLCSRRSPLECFYCKERHCIQGLALSDDFSHFSFFMNRTLIENYSGPKQILNNQLFATIMIITIIISQVLLIVVVITIIIMIIIIGYDVPTKPRARR